jgi:hypothetical protein
VSEQSTSATTPTQVEYREVPGFPGYRAGSDGSLWGKRRRRGVLLKNWRRLKGTPDKDGYLKVILSRDDGTRRDTRINIVILETFVGPCPPGLLCCHGNGRRADNRIDNLRWDTQKNNIADKKRHGTDQSGDRATNRKVSSAQVAEIRRRRAAGESGVALAREFNVSPATISAIWVGRNWKPALLSPEAA